jgi:Helix-turn-helix domain
MAAQARVGTKANMARLLAHPHRAYCLTVFSDRTTSPSAIAAELGVPVNDLAYHVRRLRDEGAIELVRTEPVRGANEHFYRATARPDLNDAAFAELPLPQRNEMTRLGVQMIAADASVALDEGTFASRTDYHVSRMPALVDEEGWEELRDIYNEAKERAGKVLEAVAARQAEDPETRQFPVRVATLVHEMPPLVQAASVPPSVEAG